MKFKTISEKNVSSQTPPCAIYKTKDIQRLYSCGVNEVTRLVELGVIPKPLNPPGKHRTRRWVKSVVDKKLGITEKESVRELVYEILQEERTKQKGNRALSGDVH